jgi:hypothetical protein
MKVWKVGHIFTDQDREYAEDLRQVIAISGRDPGPPVAMEMTERQWAALETTTVHGGDPALVSPAAPKPAERISSILTRLFGAPEEVNGAERCPTYLFRWIVLSTPWFKAYVHRFVADDWSLDLHDHPKRFISIGLWGRYTEWRPLPHGPREYRSPWIRTFPATHIHRLTLPPGRECWTIVIVSRHVREWGFWHVGSEGTRWIPWRRYVARGSEADARKACP